MKDSYNKLNEILCVCYNFVTAFTVRHLTQHFNRGREAYMKHILKRAVPFLLLLLLTGSLSASVFAAPAAVAKPKISVKKTTATITWKKVKDAKKYRVYSIDKTTNAKKLLKTTSKLTYSATKLTYNKTVSFAVSAVDATGEEGALSPVVSATPKLSPPSKPSYFELNSYGNKSVVLKWGTVSNATGYVIEYYNATKKEWVLKKTIKSRSTRKIEIKGLKADKEYKFRIRAYKTDAGLTVYSSPASKTVTVTAKKFSSALLEIRRPRYIAKLKKAMKVTDTKTGDTINLKKNQKIYVNSKSSAKVTGYLIDDDDTKFKISMSVLTYTGLESYTEGDFSKSVKTQFINTKGFKSSTDYLIWVCEYTCVVNIFKGSAGNWKLVKSGPCVVGSWKSRTPSGLHKILEKNPYGDYGGADMRFTKPDPEDPSSTGSRFHNKVDNKMGLSASHGCVRLTRSTLDYIYNNCPIGTTVYVY